MIAKAADVPFRYKRKKVTVPMEQVLVCSSCGFIELDSEQTAEVIKRGTEMMGLPRRDQNND